MKRFHGSRYVVNDPLLRLNAKYVLNKENGCWEWTAVLNEWGYGQFKYEKKMMLAHRVSYILHKGEIPDGMLACHSCDNPKCVNPDHLFLGTNKDNAVDRANKKRSRRISHPGLTSYKSGCRCIECKQFYATYQKQYKLKKATII